MALADAGMAVAYVAPGSVDDLAERLGPLPDRAVPVLVADSRGSGRAEVAGAGVTELRSATDEQDAALLVRVGEALVGQLRDCGLRAHLLPTDGTAGQAVIGLADGATAPSRMALKRLLHDHGIGGVAGLVEVATEVARDEGIESPRVTVGGSCVIVSLIDSGDIALGAAAELWRRGIDPLTLLVLVDGATWLPHRAVPVVVPDVREATFVLVGARDARERPGLLAVPGGAGGLRRVLADQLRRRRGRDLPEPVGQPGWTVGAEMKGARAMPDQDVLFALADGRVGSGGPPLAGDRADEGWTVATSVYDGTGPTTHLLAGPVVFPLGPSRRAAPVSRLLDLRSGLVHERTGSGSSAVTSVRFLALDRPTTAAVRADVPAGHRTGPPVRAPHGADSVETGLLAATRWIRVAGDTRGHRRRRRADPCRATRRERRAADTRRRRSRRGHPVRDRRPAVTRRRGRRGR